MELYNTRFFRKWITRLKDRNAKAKIRIRLRNIKVNNHFGDCEPVGGNVLELRINYGPGYRVYLTMKETTVVILLIGGDKSSQARDIKRAKKLAAGRVAEEVEKWF